MIKKILFILFIGIFLIGIISATGEVCCEKLKNNGPYCMNAPEEECDSNFRIAPTSCDSTSYCRPGCCYDNKYGTCSENTPQIVCENPNDGSEKGIWSNSASCEIPQCNLGCCLIGDQAAFVTQTRCKALASTYGLQTDFRIDIENELTCLASATSDEKGACVFERDYEKTCKFLSQKECNQLATEEEGVSFHAGFLCSAPELGTDCGKSDQTTCVEGKDEVYYLDTCGNIANIYWKNPPADYWTKRYTKQEVCGYGNSNAGNSNCGNCDYYEGSTCKPKERFDNIEGGYVCKDLSCEYDGEIKQHGETWCADSKGISEITANDRDTTDPTKENLPGSRYFRLVCYNGEVTVEPCADYRQEVCIQSTIKNEGKESFSVAACRANRWQDCVSQETYKDCINTDRRDCQWINSGNLNEYGQPTQVCVPKYGPGFDFWQEGDAESLCGMATTQCVVTYRKELFDSWECEGKEGDNCHCLENTWESEKAQLCYSLGDCGSNIKNFLGYIGYDSKQVIKIGGVKEDRTSGR